MSPPGPDLRALHGGVLLAALALPHFVPGLARWPWHLLAPLLAYALVVAAVPALRHSLVWLRVGRCDRISAAAALGVVLVSSSALVLFEVAFRPDARAQAEQLPRVADSVVLSAAAFALLNAALEEVVFRGALFDALDARWGGAAALAVTSVVFGAVHFGGYPPGLLGAVLAGAYGALVGGLRLRTGGLSLPVAVHVGADVTVFAILAGAV